MANVRDILEPLAPRTQRHHFVECITTEESPLRLTVFDEEKHDFMLAQFGAACNVLPSSVPQRLSYRTSRRG